MRDTYKVLLIGLSSRILVVTVFVISSLLFTTGASSANNPISVVSLFSRWDSGWYHDIAANGYPVGAIGGQWAFFPLYPFVMRGLSSVFLPFFSFDNALNLAGFVISNAMFFVGIYYFYRLTNILFNSPKIALTSTVFYCFFAGAVFYSAIYSESLFMALALASFYYLEENRLYLSVLFGFLASFTRIDGFFIFIPFIISALFSVRDTSRALKLALCSLAVASPFLLFQLVGYVYVGIFPVSLIARFLNWGIYPPLLIQFMVYPMQVYNKTGYQILYAAGFTFMFLPLGYFVSRFFSRSLEGIKNNLIRYAEAWKYWGYYASALYIVLEVSYIGSTIRYSVTMLPIYWVSAILYSKNRSIGIILFAVMAIMLIIGSYLLEINGYFM